MNFFIVTLQVATATSCYSAKERRRCSHVDGDRDLRGIAMDSIRYQRREGERMDLEFKSMD